MSIMPMVEGSLRNLKLKYENAAAKTIRIENE
jgi:hypothetical protein